MSCLAQLCVPYYESNAASMSRKTCKNMFSFNSEYF